MEMAAHRPEEALAALEAAQLLRRHQALVDEVGDAIDAVGELADPEQRVEVAQTALAFLEIGLDDIATVAHPLVTNLALGELFAGEGADIALHHLASETLRSLVIEPLVAPDEARLQERGADRQIAARHPHHLVDRAAGMADLQPQVPQRVEHRFDYPFGPGRLLAGGE